MSQTSITRMWQWLSLAALGYLVASWLNIAGAANITSNVLLVQEPDPVVGYAGAIIGSGLMIGALSCAIIYAGRSRGRPWQQRIPVAFLTLSSPRQLTAKIYQAFMSLVLIGIPLAVIGVCLAAAERGNLCELDTSNWAANVESNLFTLMSPQGQPVKQADYQAELTKLEKTPGASAEYKEEIKLLAERGDNPIPPSQIRLVGDRGTVNFCIGKIVKGVEMIWWLSPAVWVLPIFAWALGLVWLAFVLRPRP